MNQIIAYLLSALVAIIGFRTGLLDPLFVWIKDFALTDVPNFMWSILPPAFSEYFNQFDLSQVSQYAGDFAWFFPFWAIIAVYFTAISISLTVLLLRYIIGWVPTIEG